MSEVVLTFAEQCLYTFWSVSYLIVFSELIVDCMALVSDSEFCVCFGCWRLNLITNMSFTEMCLGSLIYRINCMGVSVDNFLGH